MPLTSKGEKILKNMEEEYGAKKGESVFYASRNKGTIGGVDNMLNFGGGYPTSTPTGPGDTPFTMEIGEANAVLDHGELAARAAQYLGKNPMAVQDALDLVHLGSAQDSPPSNKKESQPGLVNRVGETVAHVGEAIAHAGEKTGEEAAEVAEV
jgi:hypothetical protein